ncbi:MAG: tetratricopeptide repeat protein [Verrucomicrobiota bacterium]
MMDPSGFREWFRAAASRDDFPDPILLFSAEDQLSPMFRQSGGHRPAPVVQVVPIERGIGERHFESWRSTLPKNARGNGAFVLDNGAIRGGPGFERIRVTPVTLPGEWPKRPLLVVDAGFFLPLYKDEVRTPMVPLVMKLVATLASASIRWDRAKIISRNRDREFPLEFGYVPQLLREVLSDPESFRDRLPERWDVLDRAQQMAFFGQAEEAEALYGKLTGFPGLAAARYQAAQLSFKSGADFREGLRRLAAAAEEDAAYSRGFLVQGAAFWERGNLPAAVWILRQGRALFPEDAMMAVGLARNLAEQAVNARREDPAGAERMIREALSLKVPEQVRAEIIEGWGAGPFPPIAPSRPAGGQTGNPAPGR